MYWIFLLLFLFITATPEFVRGVKFGLTEDMAETLVVFLLGATGFALFFLKEKSFLRQVREKILLQREKSDISKDLSESYSYIGETNRRLDLVKGLVLSVPEMTERLRRGEKRKAYQSYEKSVLMACKSAAFLIRIVDTEQGVIEKEIRNGKVSSCAAIPVETLIRPGKKLYEENGCVIARSSGAIDGCAAYLLFPKTMNRIEDPDMLVALATQSLVLYFLERVEWKNDGSLVTKSLNRKNR